MVNSDVAFCVLLFARNFLSLNEVKNNKFYNFLFYVLFHLSNSCDMAGWWIHN